MRLPPDTIWNGITRGVTHRVPVETELGAIDRDAGERLVGIDDEALFRKMRPSTMRGMPSGPISARMRADTGMSGSYCPSPSRIASIRSLAGNLVGLDIDDAMSVRPGRHGRAQHPGPFAASEPTVKAMPPPSGGSGSD